VPSDSSRRAKVRIASIELKPNFSHVARPIVDPTVYLRASARNTSAYRLVAGRARIYVGEDSVGEAQFPTVPPGAEVEFWLGGDPRIKLRGAPNDDRKLVASEARGAVSVAQRLADARANGFEQLVAHAVAVQIVEAFEAVKVDQQQRGAVALCATTQRLCEGGLKRRAVEQPR
jgi:hypothetical protein